MVQRKAYGYPSRLCCWCCFLSRCLLTLCILLRVQRLGRHKLLSNAIDTIVSGASIVIFLATMIEISSSGIASAVKLLFNSSLHSRLCSGVRYRRQSQRCLHGHRCAARGVVGSFGDGDAGCRYLRARFGGCLHQRLYTMIGCVCVDECRRASDAHASISQHREPVVSMIVRCRFHVTSCARLWRCHRCIGSTSCVCMHRGRSVT